MRGTVGDSCERWLLLDLQRGRLGRRGRELAAASSAGAVSLPRPVPPSPPLAVSFALPVATYWSPNCSLNNLGVLLSGLLATPPNVSGISKTLIFSQVEIIKKRKIRFVLKIYSLDNKQMCKQFSYRYIVSFVL